MEHVSVLVGLQHDVLKLLYIGVSALVFDGVLERILALLAERTHGSNEALAVDGIVHIGRFQFVLRHHVGLHPHPQGVGAAVGLHVAHALHAFKTGENVYLQIIGNEVLVVLAIVASETANLQITVLTLLRAHTHTGNLGR